MPRLRCNSWATARQTRAARPATARRCSTAAARSTQQRLSACAFEPLSCMSWLDPVCELGSSVTWPRRLPAAVVHSWCVLSLRTLVFDPPTAALGVASRRPFPRDPNLCPSTWRTWHSLSCLLMQAGQGGGPSPSVMGIRLARPAL
jgi:hypothetical protein